MTPCQNLKEFKLMDNEPIDRDMAHVILNAFKVSSQEGMSSLTPNYRTPPDKPVGWEYAKAERRVLEYIATIYPFLAKDYFDLE